MASRVIQVELVGDSTQLNRALGQAQTSLGRFGGKLQATGRAMTRTLTLPIVGAAAAATKYTYDFDQSLNHIQALVGANTKQMEAYRASILKLAPSVGQGPDELAKALYFITSSGFQGAKALDVLKASARAAAAGLGDTQQVADLVTTAVSAYGVKTLSAAHATDVLTAAVRLGKAEPADFVNALGRVIPVAQAMGVSFGEVSGAVAALTVSGQNTEIAVTGIRQVLLNILKPSAQAKDALHSVGLSTQELQRVVSRQGIVPALELLNTKFHGNRQEMSKVISNARSLTVAMALIGPNAQKASSTIDQVTHSSGEAAKAFQTQSQTMAFQVQKAWATIQTSAVQVGSIILPVFADVATSVAKIASAFGTLPSGMQEVAVGAALGVAALGPLLTAFGNVAKAASGMKLALLGAQGGFKGIIPLLAANPWVAVGLAVAAVGAYAIITSRQTDELAGAMNQARTASDELGRALSGLKQSNLDVRQAELDRANAADRLKKADQTAAELARKGKKGTAEYTQAIRSQKQAEIDLGDAKLRVQQADAQRASKQSQVAKANQDNLRAIQRIAHASANQAKQELVAARAQFVGLTASQRSAKEHEIAQRALRKYIDATNKVAVAASEEAVKVGKTNPVLATAKARAAAMALAAEDLAAKIHHVPTIHAVKVYYRNNIQTLIDEARNLAGALYNIPGRVGTTVYTNFVQAHGVPAGGAHARGGMAYRGQLSLVGERGPELRMEGNNARYLPAYQTRQALGAGGPPAFNVDVYIGGERLDSRIDTRVEVREQKTAQTIRSGKKWG